jgi:DNA modification methylase
LKQYGYKQKDLIGIPWMVAFTLRNDGWYLRDDIVWAKGYSGNMRGGNVMPESVKDRCTKAYEHVFMLTKSKKYYYDYNAVLEPSIKAGETFHCNNGKSGQLGKYGQTREGFLREDGIIIKSSSNPRNVWLINPKPFKGAHYAVFPPELVRLPILAGTSEKGHCPKCGAKWVRDIERKDKRHWTERQNYKDTKYTFEYGKTKQSNEINRNDAPASFVPPEFIDNGWIATCDCGLEPVPDVVLDPFCGSGTTVMVAKELGREAIGLDLSFTYLHDIAKPRLGILS